MTALFVAIVLAVFAGGVCLWLSGLLVGRRLRPDAARGTDPAVAELRADRGRLEEALRAATAQIEEVEARAGRVDETKAKAEAEVGRAAAELGRAASEMAKAEQEIGRLKQEADALRLELEAAKEAGKHKLKPPTPTKMGLPERRSDAGPSEDLDHALAELDLERVAHQKTRDELDHVKRGGGTVQISDGRPSVPPPLPGLGVPGRRGAGFQTVSIAARGAPTTEMEHDRLHKLNEHLQREKERVEAELARAQQELQLLRMRQNG